MSIHQYGELRAVKRKLWRPVTGVTHSSHYKARSLEINNDKIFKKNITRSL